MGRRFSSFKGKVFASAGETSGFVRYLIVSRKEVFLCKQFSLSLGGRNYLVKYMSLECSLLKGKGLSLLSFCSENTGLPLVGSYMHAE